MEPPASPSPITIEARLVHAEAGQRVVEVSGWLQGQCIGRCLGEASSAEDAEDRALARLEQRLVPGVTLPQAPVIEQAVIPVTSAIASPPARPKPAPPQRMAATSASSTGPDTPSTPEGPPGATRQPSSDGTAPAPPASAPQLPPLGLDDVAGDPPIEEPTADPEDWSEELAELDVQLKRLGWDRNQEGTYLQRAFGHPSRNRLTAFADLVAYLRALRSVAGGSHPETAPVPLRRRDLLSQCDQLLASLGWDPQRGRQMLEHSFQLSSRQQLSDEQLLAFNMLLESELIDRGSAPAAAANPG